MPAPPGPRRPTSAAVYRRRRLAVVVLLLAVVLVGWVLVRAVAGGDEGEPGAAPTATPAPATSEPPEPPVATEPTVAPEPTEPTEPAGRVGRERDVAVERSPADVRCRPSSVTVAPHVPASSPTGRTVEVAMSISTTAGRACLLDLDRTPLLVAVSPADDPDLVTYTSDACREPLTGPGLRLDPRWTTVTAVAWSGRASGPRCTEDAAYAPAGTYVLQAATLGGEPGVAEVELVDPLLQETDDLGEDGQT